MIDTETAAGNRRLASLAHDKRTVRVQNANGQLINPCHPARARQLKRKHRVSLVCRHPFTIRLDPECPVEDLLLFFEEDFLL